MMISSIAEIASLMGDPARANMLFALKDEGQITAGDLSRIAGVAPSTTSEHLAKLTEAGLVEMRAQGRKRYYRLAAAEVGDLLEGLETVADSVSGNVPTAPPDYEAILHARSCYDHLAGRVGARLAVAMMEKGYVSNGGADPVLTEAGAEWLDGMDVDVRPLKQEPRRFLRMCPDWSERSVHIGGAVGAAMLRAMVGRDWMRRVRGSPRIAITPKGVAGLRSQLGLEISRPAPDRG